MATVHRGTSWGTDPGASTQKWELEPRSSNSPERLKRLAQGEPSAFSRPIRSARPKREESPTIEISVDFGAAEADAAIVIAVTEDHELRNALTDALSRDVVLFAETPEQVLARPVPDNCGVLIVEQSLGRPAFEKLKSHLKTSAPAMVSIMVGTQIDGSSLVGLLSAGCIDRFMVKPLKQGPTRSALRSALQQHQSQRLRDLGDRPKPTLFAVESAPVASTTQVTNQIPPLVDAEAMELRDEQDSIARGTPIVLPAAAVAHLNSAKLAEPIVHASAEESNQVVSVNDARSPREAQVSTTPRQWPTPSWTLIAAVVIAVAGFVAWGMSVRTPELNVDKMVASYLATAQKAFEVGNYVDPPELSAVHFYTVALEMDPKSAQAKRGLEAVTDRLIADAKQLIIAGDLLRVQSMVDNVRRVQPTHRELAAVTALLLEARDAERLAINAAHTATQVNVASATVQSAVAAASQREPTVATAAEKPSTTIERKVQQPIANPQRQRVAKTDAAFVAKAPSPSTKSVDSKSVPAETQPTTSLNRSLESVQAETASRDPLKIAPMPPAVTEVPSLVSAEPPSATLLATTSVPGSAPSVAHEKMKLIKYVPPVYPSIARGSNNEGWLDVNFLVTTDGSVVNPSIGNGTASRLFHRAAINAVSQWKFSPAPNGAAEQRPMHVRLEFKLTN